VIYTRHVRVSLCVVGSMCSPMECATPSCLCASSACLLHTSTSVFSALPAPGRTANSGSSASAPGPAPTCCARLRAPAPFPRVWLLPTAFALHSPVDVFRTCPCVPHASPIGAPACRCVAVRFHCASAYFRVPLSHPPLTPFDLSACGGPHCKPRLRRCDGWGLRPAAALLLSQHRYLHPPLLCVPALR
jgi:hypothetical protein